MALYAFDGTGQDEIAGAAENSNVVRFKNAYQGATVYLAGIGSRGNRLVRWWESATGYGGRSRVDAALKELNRRLAEGDETIDIVGYSRGAALALEFANEVAARVQRPGGAPPIRFVGLWDVVGSFGIPGNDINLSYDLYVPAHVVKCYHAMALDERRQLFPVTRLQTRVPDADQDGRVYEMWFRGVHSDVGGGNSSRALSSIALNWMLHVGRMSGLPFHSDAVEANRRDMSPAGAIYSNVDLIENDKRIIRWNDWIHASVERRDPKRHNNPPRNAPRVADDLKGVGRFV